MLADLKAERKAKALAELRRAVKEYERVSREYHRDCNTRPLPRGKQDSRRRALWTRSRRAFRLVERALTRRGKSAKNASVHE